MTFMLSSTANSFHKVNADLKQLFSGDWAKHLVQTTFNGMSLTAPADLAWQRRQIDFNNFELIGRPHPMARRLKIAEIKAKSLWMKGGRPICTSIQTWNFGLGSVFLTIVRSKL